MHKSSVRAKAMMRMLHLPSEKGNLQYLLLNYLSHPWALQEDGLGDLNMYMKSRFLVGQFL